MGETGLLDFLKSPEGQGLLAAGFGAAAGRGTRMQAIGQGGLAGLLAYGRAGEMQADQARQKAQDERADTMFGWQKNAYQQQQDALAKAQAQQAAQQNYLGSIGQVTSPRLDAQPNQFDPIKWRALGGSLDEAQKLAGMGDWGRAEVARTLESQDAQGNKITLQFDKFGRPVGDGVQGYTAPVQVDLGGRVQFVKPQAGVNLTKTMTPGERDASARGWSGLNLQRDQFAYSKSKDAQERADKMAGGTGNATEDERKAAGWLAQASTAWSNMQKAMGGIDPKTGKFKNPDVAMPGLPDAIAAIPSFGLGEVVGNTMRSPARQQFNQASSSMGEAILRAATGAGVNQYEAEQKVRELTPVFGEDPTTTEQKMRAIPVYLDSLKARAGRAAPKDWTIPVVNAPSDDNGWSIRPK